MSHAILPFLCQAHQTTYGHLSEPGIIPDRMLLLDTSEGLMNSSTSSSALPPKTGKAALIPRGTLTAFWSTKFWASACRASPWFWTAFNRTLAGSLHVWGCVWDIKVYYFSATFPREQQYLLLLAFRTLRPWERAHSTCRYQLRPASTVNRLYFMRWYVHK